jgi:hypothetical protein
MTDLTRRSFLRGAAGLALVPTSITGLVAACSRAGGSDKSAPRISDYGPLLDPPSGEPLALPEGFSVRAIGRVGDVMSDGRQTPLGHDGMAAFSAPRGRVRLVRNHEARNSPGFNPPIGGGARAYDRLADGGTTTLEFDRAGRLVRDFVSLEGTIVNCAGGPTPQGSWLTCEEAVDGPLEGFEKPHGYVFEVPSAANGPVVAVPLKAMGRFQHEAIACDPATGFVYLTEDNGRADGPGSGFYRFRPVDPDDLRAGGALDMLKVVGDPGRILHAEAEAFVDFAVEWVPIADPDPADADEFPLAERETLVFGQGAEQGAAAFQRLEGCWYGEDRVFFHDTCGGPVRKGHVWEYDPGAESLRLVFVSPGVDVLDSPDNLTVSPNGSIVICEDGSGTQYVRGLTRDGHIFDLARNTLNNTEFAGATFSPDGATLFVNIQGSTSGKVTRAVPGVTLAIRGPWERGPL